MVPGRAVRLEEGLALYRSMLRIRHFEERVAAIAEAKEVRTPTHLYTGQEAVAAGVCLALETRDQLLGNHRSHGHYLAKGGDTRALMAEIFCRIDGCAKGRGGSMHVIDTSVGILGTVPMVAGTIPVATGAALAAKLEGTGRVVVSFFGDSATEEGVFHESVNFADLMDLPILFVCENNLFSSHLPLKQRRKFSKLSEMLSAYSMPSKTIDGNDALAVFDAAREAVERARAGKGATFLECNTYRWRGHVGPSYDLGLGIREKEEVDMWMARDPIARHATWLLSQGATRAQLDAIDAEERALVEEAVRFARASPSPRPESVHEAVFVEVAP